MPHSFPSPVPSDLQFNLSAVFATIQAASVHMKRQRSGRIIVTASVAGLRAERHVGYAYVATKAAVVNLVRHAAIELAEYGVCVKGIAPGPILTNLARGKRKNGRASCRARVGP